MNLNGKVFLLILMNQFCIAQVTIINKSDYNKKEISFGYRNTFDSPMIIKHLKHGDQYTIKLDNSDNQNINFVSINKQNLIYAFPNDTIYVSRGENGDFVFKGNREKEWNFMIKLATMGYPLLGSKNWNFKDVEYDEYLDNAKKQYDAVFDYIEKAKDSLNFSKEFYKLLKKEMEFAFVQFFIKGHMKYKKIDNFNYGKVRDLLASYERFFLTYKPSNSLPYSTALWLWDIFMSKNHENATIFKTSKTYNEQAGYDLDENFSDRFERAKLYEEPLKSALLFKLISYRFDANIWQNEEEYEPYVNYFLKVTADSSMKKRIREMSGIHIIRADKKSQIEIIDNQAVLNNNLVTVEGKIHTWKEVLSLYRGKIIYLDLWASWCAPCRKEIIASHEKKKLLSAKDSTVFINISLDENKLAWQKAMKDLKMLEDGSINYQLSFDSALGKAIVGDRTVPKYVIIDKNGRLLTIAAPRPSSPIFIKTLDRLVKP